MTTALVFPGQGSQAVGMAQGLAESFAEAREVLQQVDDALSFKLSALMKDGPEAELTATANAQPAIMAASLAAYRVMEKQLGFSLIPSPAPPASGRDSASPLAPGGAGGTFPPFTGGIKGGNLASYVAGHSLGEYSALTAAGSLSVAEAARLLRIRGNAMQAAVPAGQGGMVAVIGPELKEVEAMVIEARKRAAGEVIEIANHNSTNQIVLSGSAKGMEVAIEVAKEKGAKRALPLAVSAPFHCSLMRPAADAMAAALQASNLKAPIVPLIANVTADLVTDPAQIKSLLVQQVTGMVRWVDSIERMKTLGVARIIEVGHGNVLAGLIKRIAPEIAVVNIAGPADVESYSKAA